jgi:hypothetical protein
MTGPMVTSLRPLDEVAKIICRVPVGVHRGPAPCEACYVRAEALFAASSTISFDGGLVLLVGPR